MSFIQALVAGTPGTYQILGGEVTLRPPKDPSSSEATKIYHLICTKLGGIGRFYAFTHEYCHSLMAKWLISGYAMKITILTNELTGRVSGKYNYEKIENGTPWQQTLITYAGGVGNTFLAVCQLVALYALRSYTSWPISLVLALPPVTVIIVENLRLATGHCHQLYLKSLKTF